ncbi:MAG: isochorismatase family cysteine hydrolase [Pseudomonadota bacterium]
MTNSRHFSEEEVHALARDAYERGVCEFPVMPGRSALLVIDMQEEFVKPNWTPYWVPAATRIVPRIARLLESCRNLGVPVIFTAFGSTHRFLDRPLTGSLMPNRYARIPHDSSWFREGKIVASLEPRSEEITILKPSYGAFYDTPLETVLKNLGRDTVIISGTLTNFCCGMTARQAYERGFHVVFGADVTASDDAEMHENELKNLRKGFARVMTAEEILVALGA